MAGPDVCPFCKSERQVDYRYVCGTFLSPEMFPEWQISAACKRITELVGQCRDETERYEIARDEIAVLDEEIRSLRSESERVQKMAGVRGVRIVRETSCAIEQKWTIRLEFDSGEGRTLNLERTDSWEVGAGCRDTIQCIALDIGRLVGMLDVSGDLIGSSSLDDICDAFRESLEGVYG